MTQLTPNFTLEELTRSDTATRLGLDNQPSPEILERLKVTAAGLERVRAILGYAIIVSSGYRSITLNAHIPGSSNTSAHCQGYAADFTCPHFGAPLEACRAIARSGMKFDQLIQEGAWTHISFDAQMRQQLLTAHFGNGPTTYTAGFV